MKKIIMVGAVIGAMALGGCAKLSNKISADGGLFGSYPGNYVVIKYSGGVITDLWKLDEQIIQSEQGSDGWLFKDSNDNPVHIGGDMKSIRFNHDRKAMDAYVEYHMDTNGGTYAEFLSKHR